MCREVNAGESVVELRSTEAARFPLNSRARTAALVGLSFKGERETAETARFHMSIRRSGKCRFLEGRSACAAMVHK